jgi:hypothetical protein
VDRPGEGEVLEAGQRDAEDDEQADADVSDVEHVHADAVDDYVLDGAKGTTAIETSEEVSATMKRVLAAASGARWWVDGVRKPGTHRRTVADFMPSLGRQ